MRKPKRRHIMSLTLAALLGAGLLLWQQQPHEAHIEQPQLADGSRLTVAVPAAKAKARVLLALPADQQLSPAELLALAQNGDARLIQFELPAGDCAAQQNRLKAAAAQLDGPPTLVAGIGPGAALAWRWLAGQADDNARALSIDFDLDHPDCAAPLPQQATHGHWRIAWNDYPDDASATFARGQGNADTHIGNYDTPLAQLLREQLHDLLQGAGDDLPVVEVPAKQPADTVTLFYSGDGGWRDLDRDVADEMAAQGHPVVGIDALRYFWQHKSPEQCAADLSRLMQSYRQKWGAKRFVLAGYSFGADILPATYNRLPAADRAQIDALLLIALARSGSFEIEVQGWLGKAGQERPTGPELLKVPATKVLCVYGSEEAAESGCTQPGAIGERLELPGGHHFDEDYPALARRLVQAIRQRQEQAATP
ncbi:MAG TPA: AcvB/VirJ family lysyl-phosphatidylglycerol hydrolase [Pseudomonas sp.]|nr:AcvB/VirJ family lysyl-phosphatidylglycerol hydrolase [Pseudomonas sp.]